MGNLLSRLRANRNRICVIHYACTDISKMLVKIPCIVLAEYSTRNTKTFSTIDLRDEKNVFKEFYRFIQKKNHNLMFVGWNSKDVVYGLPAIERRYKQLFGKAPPQIKTELVIDLDDAIEEIYGKLYVDHRPNGKMYNLFSLNGMSTLNFLKGKDEAERCEQNDIRSVELSTSCKIRGIMSVLDLYLDGRLKTTRTIERWGKLRQLVYRAKNSTLFWIITIVATILGILGFIVLIVV